MNEKDMIATGDTSWWDGCNDPNLFYPGLGFDQLFKPGERAEWNHKWFIWCVLSRALTKELYGAMDKDTKKKQGRIGAWRTTGGLNVVSGGRVADKFAELKAECGHILWRRAVQLRREAGWTDERGKGTFLVDPNGKTKTRLGMPYGKWSIPGAEDHKGVWDGVLRDTIFTK